MSDCFGFILHLAVQAFIVMMLFWMIFWDSEAANPVKRHFIPKIMRPFLWLGLRGEWRMFSPNPPQRTFWPKIRLTMANGEFVDWEPTHFSQLSVGEKVRFKKFHKFYFMLARTTRGYVTQQSFIDHLLSRNLTDQPCVKAEVFLVYHVTPRFNKPPPDEVKIYKRLVYVFELSGPLPP